MMSDLGGDDDKVSVAHRHEEIMSDGDKAFKRVVFALAIIVFIACSVLFLLARTLWSII